MFLNSKAQCVSCKVYFTNKVTLCFISVESENQSGSLKRLGSARQLPADLRALQSPLNTIFNPEGIYVWFCTGHQPSNTVCTSHMTPYHSETMKIYFGEIILPGITEESVVCSTDSSTSSECFLRWWLFPLGGCLTNPTQSVLSPNPTKTYPAECMLNFTGPKAQ